MSILNDSIDWSDDYFDDNFIKIKDIKDFLLQQGYEWDKKFCSTKFNVKEEMYEILEKHTAKIDLLEDVPVIEIYDINKEEKDMRYLQVSNIEFSLLHINHYDDPDWQRESISLSIQWQKYLLNKYGEEYASQLIECVRERRVEVKLTLDEYSSVLEILNIYLITNKEKIVMVLKEH